MLDHVVNCVQAFHTKYGVSEGLEEMPKEMLQELVEIGDDIVRLSQLMEKRLKEDPRWLAAHLLAEEVGEMIMAMASGDEIGALDGAADLQYIVAGRAAQFNWPLGAAFAEVHRSNMTKTRKEEDPGRVRDKGASYEPPDITKVLDLHRNFNNIIQKDSPNDDYS